MKWRAIEPCFGVLARFFFDPSFSELVRVQNPCQPRTVHYSAARAAERQRASSHTSRAQAHTSARCFSLASFVDDARCLVYVLRPSNASSSTGAGGEALGVVVSVAAPPFGWPPPCRMCAACRWSRLAGKLSRALTRPIRR